MKEEDGAKIRLILGEDGNSYLLIMNEDDGKRRWQSTFWSNIPLELSKQIKKIQANKRRITDVSFAPGDRWYICGKRWDGSGEYHRWGGCSEFVSDALDEWSNEPRKLQVSFGKEEQTFLQLGSNSYWDAGCPEVDTFLSVRMEERQDAREEVHFVRLFPFFDEKDPVFRNSFFIRDEEGTEWKGNLGHHLEKELQKSDTIHDVAIAGDGTWCVIHDSNFTISTGINQTIDDQISSFFKRQKDRRDIQRHDTRKYNEFEHASIPEEPEISEEERQREAYEAIQAKRKEQERRERRQAEERELEQMRKALMKKFAIGSRVTVLGCSLNEGDAVVKDHALEANNNCFITVEHDNKTVYRNIDPMEIKLFDSEKQKDALTKKCEDVLSKRMKRNQCEREHIISSHAMNYGMFLWRGLRGDETGKGLFAKDPAASLDKNEVLENDSVHSQYIHLTKSPEIAIYDSVAISCTSVPYRIAQVDLSMIDSKSIYDVSSGAGLNPRAAELAKSKEVVLVYEHIPFKAVTIHTIEVPVSVPKHVDDTSSQYLERIKGDDKLISNIQRWRRERLEYILEKECESYSTSCVASKYSSHLLFLARLISESAMTSNDMSNLSKTILTRGALFSPDGIMMY